MAKAFYAWSSIRNGGEVGEVTLPNGGTKRVVISRNIIEPGSKVTKANSGLSDEEWDRMVASGVIRNYPFPDGTDEYTSPSQALMKQLAVGGEIPTDRLMEMAMSPASEDEGGD